jgi:hypothetical protein
VKLELNRFRFISLQVRFLLGTVLVLLLVMAAVIAVVERRQRAAIIDEVERRGEVIAENLAAVSRVPLLLYNFTALEQNVARVGRPRAPRRSRRASSQDRHLPAPGDSPE